MQLHSRFIAAIFAFGLGISIAHPAMAGISVGSTRVIFDGAKSDVSVPIHNTDSRSYLVQSWVDDKDGHKAPFLVTPPLVRVDANKGLALKIIRTGELPQDRESVLYFNVKEIPPKAEGENVLQLAVRTRIKLFYRPAQLAGRPEQAPTLLQWHVVRDAQGKFELEVKNPSAYAVTVVDATADGKPLRNDMVEPQHTLRYPLPDLANPHVNLVFSTMDDFGGTTLPISVSVDQAAK